MTTTLARNTDPATSHLAARNAARRFAPTHEQKILDAISRTQRPCRVDDDRQIPMFSST